MSREFPFVLFLTRRAWCCFLFGDKLMPRFVKLATLSDLPEGSAAEVEFEGTRLRAL